MLIYLALLEHIAPLGGGHDVFIKDAIRKSYPHTKEESHFVFLVHGNKEFFLLSTGKRTIGQHDGTLWHQSTELRWNGAVRATLAMEPKAITS